ncbi:TorF family putative porin [Pelomonas sp. KK5]|uniref:TorF family putative porin n=1 Tax=Pelomonas sp. KK5 TaxID=1855730 RepID=UPI00097CB0AA|nr:TorF family putative porin [Pelomonas sp. KK5]
MKSRSLAPFLLAGLAAPGIPASAAEPASTFHWDSGAVLGTSRMWRGQQQTDGKLALSGELKLSHDGGAYAGIWAGSLDLGPDTDTQAEIDYFVGWGRRFGKWSVNAGYLYRQRPSATMSLDFQEVTASVSYDLGAVRPGGGVYYSWDYFQGGRSTYVYLNLRAPFGTVHGFHLTGSAAVGHYDFSNHAIGNYEDADLRLIARRGAWQYSVGLSDTNVRASTSGLLTRDRSGARARAEVLVMF